MSQHPEPDQHRETPVNIQIEKVRLILNFAQVGTLVLGVWLARGWIAGVESSISRVSEQIATLKRDAESDRAELRRTGEELVRAVNRITAIEARGR